MRNCSYSLLPAAPMLLGVGTCVHQSAQPGTIKLRFEAAMGDKPLVFNQASYPNPGGPVWSKKSAEPQVTVMAGVRLSPQP